jgi:hypothetical protein
MSRRRKVEALVTHIVATMEEHAKDEYIYSDLFEMYDRDMPEADIDVLMDEQGIKSTEESTS